MLPNSSTTSSCNIAYEVVNGDTLGKIAKKFGTTYQEIASINGIPNPDKIQVGQVLLLLVLFLQLKIRYHHLQLMK